jgi:hypothetical protein
MQGLFFKHSFLSFLPRDFRQDPGFGKAGEVYPDLKSNVNTKEGCLETIIQINGKSGITKHCKVK